MDKNILVAVVNSMGRNLNGPGILYIKSGEPVETEHTRFARGMSKTHVIMGQYAGSEVASGFSGTSAKM